MSETALTVIPSGSPESLLALAIEKGISVEGIEKLMVMAREVRQERARAAYVEAMSQFQSECPVIEKTREVLNKDGRTVRYKYAAMEDIKSVISGPMERNGLSFSFDTTTGDGMMVVSCKVQHDGGHSETSDFGVPLADSQYMSQAQNFASTLTYAKRYALCNALGLVIGDEDNDATPVSKEEPKPTQPKPAPTAIPAGWLKAISRVDGKDKASALWEAFCKEPWRTESMTTEFGEKLDARLLEIESAAGPATAKKDDGSIPF